MTSPPMCMNVTKAIVTRNHKIEYRVQGETMFGGPPGVRLEHDAADKLGVRQMQLME